MSSPSSAPQHLEFKAELKQLLDLIIHSLYTRKEIFLRELISNAADAIDKVRFEALTDTSLLEGNSDWKIRLIPDEKAGTLTISDNGRGMSPQSIIEDLGTIARSGTRQFLESLKHADVKNRPELIGQFGVGFYSAFMVADRVTVVSRMAGDKAHGVRWESDGQGQYTVEPAERELRGTDVILHLREDAREFLDPWRLREIVKRYSDFIEHPIVMDVEREKDGQKTVEEETLNSRKAIWLRSRQEIKAEEYEEFYRQLTRDTEAPLRTIHIAAEGPMEFRALLYLPAHRPMDLFWREPKAGLDLYVRRVLIMHECEQLLPTWLRIVKGVVDSSDLPLNVSREMLQHNAVLAKIKTNLVTRILKTLEELRDEDAEKYAAFHREFGTLLREGVAQDFANRQRLADLMLMESTKTEPGKQTTLAKYVEALPADQKEILYLVGDSRAQLDHSPYLEGAKAKGWDVLLLTDPADEFVMESLGEYKGKKLKALDRGELSDSNAEQRKEAAEQHKSLFEAMRQKLSGEVKEVRLSSRLTDSAACLVADEHGLSAHMERLMQRVGRGDEVAGNLRILELNAEHPAVQALRAIHEKNAADPRIEDYARLLYDEAVLAEGSKVKDPAGMARRINALLVKAATGG